MSLLNACLSVLRTIEDYRVEAYGEVESASMKVLVNANLCDAYAKCVMICPDVFHLEGFAVTDPEAEVPESLIEKVRRAEAACPTGAIVILSA
jgi:ferredoxin